MKLLITLLARMILIPCKVVSFSVSALYILGGLSVHCQGYWLKIPTDQELFPTDQERLNLLVSLSVYQGY